MSDPSVSLFGALVLRQRKARGWTVRDLRERTGIAINTISRTERGIGQIALSSAVKLAAALDIELCALVPCAGHAAVCRTCANCPPAGFTCNECGRGGAT